MRWSEGGGERERERAAPRRRLPKLGERVRVKAKAR